MDVVELHQPAPDLSEVIQHACAGRPFMIAVDGKLVAQVTPFCETCEVSQNSGVEQRRKLGGLEGRFQVPDDFDTMFQKEIEEMFYGKSE